MAQSGSEPMQAGIDGVVEVKFVDKIAVVYMKCGENRINNSFIEKFNAALDKVESNPAIRALVLTGDPTSKFFCNGLDLNWMVYHQQTEEGRAFIHRTMGQGMRDMWCRLLVFPLPTISAINGHAFAGGAFQCLVTDYRVMRADRGWWCLNEVFLGMYFSDYLQELVRTKLPGQTLTEAVGLGRRYTGQEALDSRIVQQLCPAGGDVVQQAITLAKQLTDKQQYNRTALHNMKLDIYSNILKAKLTGRPATPISRL